MTIMLNDNVQYKMIKKYGCDTFIINYDLMLIICAIAKFNIEINLIKYLSVLSI